MKVNLPILALKLFTLFFCVANGVVYLTSLAILLQKFYRGSGQFSSDAADRKLHEDGEPLYGAASLFPPQPAGLSRWRQKSE